MAQQQQQATPVADYERELRALADHALALAFEALQVTHTPEGAALPPFNQYAIHLRAQRTISVARVFLERIHQVALDRHGGEEETTTTVNPSSGHEH